MTDNIQNIVVEVPNSILTDIVNSLEEKISIIKDLYLTEMRAVQKYSLDADVLRIVLTDLINAKMWLNIIIHTAL
jgi:hypothetical protein